MLCPDGGVVILPSWLPDLPVPALLPLLPETYDMLILQSAGSRVDFDQLPGMTIMDTPLPGTMLTEMVASLLQTRTPAPSSWQAYGGRTAGDHRKAQVHRRSPAEEKLLQSAKQRLMRTQWLTEEQAHRQMQIQSMETGLPLVELARQILGNGPESE